MNAATDTIRFETIPALREPADILAGLIWAQELDKAEARAVDAGIASWLSDAPKPAEPARAVAAKREMYWNDAGLYADDGDWY